MAYSIQFANEFTNNKTGYRLFKRCFDIVTCSCILLLLSPLLLLIGLLIKLESKGPVFYTSKRVGEGYKVFDFYKFRSMRTDADQLLEKMKSLNHYAAQAGQDEEGDGFSWEREYHPDVLVADEGYIHSEEWLENAALEERQAFLKVKNDPRITRIGHFIRNTSIDELPQLFNVLKGDMSLVGNRPLPLYEAVKLTNDQTIGRFLAPAGLTGLWQVTERGKAATSAESRKELDVFYAENFSLAMDLKILLKTPFALFQTENV